MLVHLKCWQLHLEVVQEVQEVLEHHSPLALIPNLDHESEICPTLVCHCPSWLLPLEGVQEVADHRHLAPWMPPKELECKEQA